MKLRSIKLNKSKFPKPKKFITKGLRKSLKKKQSKI